MTLAYSVLHADCVQILSDAAHYLPDGTVVDIRSKVRTSRFVPLAVTSVGSSNLGDAVCGSIIELSEVGNFDLTILMAEELVSRLAGNTPPGHDLMVIISGISENRGPCHFIASTISPNADIPAFALVHPGTRDWGNGVSDIDVELAAVGATPAVAQALGPDFLRQYGATLAGMMRRKKMTNWMVPGNVPLHGIGGFLELTTISASGCTVETIHAWPEDRIGQKIRPAQQLAEAA